MHASSRGPAMYFGYCQRSRRYRMMDLPDYVSNLQEGVSRLMSETASAYQGVLRDYTQMPDRTRACEHRDCHCECCVCDADVLVHARCGEVRRIPLTFENDTRREREVKLKLERFVTSGGRDLDWPAQLSEVQFTLRPCDEHTATLFVQIRCPRADANDGDTQKTTGDDLRQEQEGGSSALDQRIGRVDHCEVGYATIRAEGCATRPIVVAVAVLPDDCDAYRHPCGCDCCH